MDLRNLANKLERPLHPPGRDVRCIVSVGMLTEGWDCNTVTHIVGIRPFMSQLLCEQVVGRACDGRATNWATTASSPKKCSKVFGVPFEVIPFKATASGSVRAASQALPRTCTAEKAAFEIRFPRVEGYTQAIRNRVTMDWANVPSLRVAAGPIPPEVEMKGLSVNNVGRLSLSGPGDERCIADESFDQSDGVQELIFDLAKGMTKHYVAQPQCQAPATSSSLSSFRFSSAI